MQIGSIVASRYAIEAVAGTGGMCSVYRARDRAGGGLVAIKALHRQPVGSSGLPASGDAEERFSREVRVLQELRHPAIVRYLDSGVADAGERFLVMEWLHGSDLEAVLQSRVLSLAEVLAIVGRIATALGVAHGRGIIHRDVKPSNIFIVGEDVTDAKLLDFGVARWGAANRATRTGTSVGTPAYMSPEQVRGERVIDARADVFSLGCVMYECLTGEPAFVAHNPMAVFCKILLDKAPSAAELVPGLPDPVDALLQSMLAKEVERRPRDGNEVAAALAELAGRIDLEAATRPARSVSVSRQTITGDEQRLVNVIVAGAGTAMPDFGEARTVNLFPARVPALQFPSSQRVSVRFDALSDGSLVALLEASGVATDQAMNAARFALALRDEFPGSDIALATGLAVLGKTKLIGEAIDRACQMLVGNAEKPAPRPVRLDEVTAGLIAARFELTFDDHGPLLLGELAPVAERTLLGRHTPFVGRARELGALTATVDESAENRVARAVLVTGPPGSGKSRLLRELIKHIESGKGTEVWIAHGDPMRSGSPLDMMSETVRRKAGVLEGEPFDVRRQKLHALAARHMAEDRVPRVVEFLGALIGLPAGPDDSVPLSAARQDPILMADQLRRALEDLLDTHADAHPVVLILEDLHWGDQATVTLVDRLLRVLSERPFVIVAVARPELHEQFPRIWAGHNLLELQLGPLPRRAAQTLAEAVLGTDVSAERMAEIIDRADGNPFYLEELVRTAASGGGTLPDTVIAMMQARIEALEPEARRVLRAASIFGGVFWRGGLIALTGEGVGMDHWLDVLVERELIIPADSKFTGERAYRFRHEIVRDAAYTLLVREDRRLGHTLAGAWLERVGETDARALAEHFERGESTARALPLYVRAAEVALERGDFAAVLDLIERAERCGPDDDARGLLAALQGDAHYWRGEPAAASDRYFVALRLLPRGSRRWYDAFAHVMMVLGASNDIAPFENLARDLDGTGDRVGHAVAAAVTAWRLFLAGSLRLGSELLRAADDAARELGGGDAYLAANLHRARAACGLIRDGDPSAFLAELELGTLRFEEIGDAREVAWQRANIGYAYLVLGLHVEAERELRLAIVTGERMGLDYIVNGARSNLGVALQRLGRLREARATEEAAATRLEQQGDIRLAAASRMYLASILLAEGDLERAEAEARAALELFTSRTQTYGLAVLGRVLLARGEVAQALKQTSLAMDLLGESAVYEGEATVRLVHAEALRAAGDLSGAVAVIRAARDRLLERADRIGQSSWRQSFLHEVPDHARTLELAGAWTWT